MFRFILRLNIRMCSVCALREHNKINGRGNSQGLTAKETLWGNRKTALVDIKLRETANGCGTERTPLQLSDPESRESHGPR